ncbi:GNAT family N-acetyltransferase [Kitasatospora sp. GP82]|uniref:GNAT family N-acetyltransferase n=1 Tax=Kitasatospora sp. GP82 TaxID=3035089 RepID=UPI0024748F33|nr:GNAT family N-acetyltransferase [Kitasatospora sp. GP82]MDH6130250.1 putative acetyltransferase [Kitasatospora sp. GP82]
MSERILFIQAERGILDEYDDLATRSYGHPVPAVRQLAGRVDTRVAVRGGKVIAGGLGFLTGQHFGGRPVPTACLGSGCVAPEERGEHLAARMLQERIRPLREQGAVLATVWTALTKYARWLGWHAPVPAATWEVPAEALHSTFEPGALRIEHGCSPAGEQLRAGLAQNWNGPLARPSWWNDFLRDHHGAQTYEFATTAGDAPVGQLTLATTRHADRGAQLTVHGFWAADADAAAAMLAFLGRWDSRVPTVRFERTGLPPFPLLLHALPRSTLLTTHAQPPWMLRVLDVEEAVRQRGWPADLDLRVGIEIGNQDGSQQDHYLLEIAKGTAQLTPASPAECEVAFTRGQFTLWYAGAFRSTAAAQLAGVCGAPDALTALVRATCEREPWLTEHF